MVDNSRRLLSALVFLAAVLCLAATPAHGNLFVSSSLTNQVLEYDGTTGAFVTAFVGAGSGGLCFPEGLVFGPNGNLFVTSIATIAPNQVLEYNGTTGAFVTTFVGSGSGGLSIPIGLVFGPNGNLFVS